MIERRALFAASSRNSQTMAGDHRSQPRAKVEITDDQLRAVCKRFAPEIAKMKIMGGEEAVIEGNVKFLTAIARHTARFPNTRALAKNAANFVPECDQSELVTWAHAVGSAFKHCQDRYNRKVKKIMPAIANVVNAMRERDGESMLTDVPLQPSPSPSEPEPESSAPPTSVKKRSLHEIRAAYGLSPPRTGVAELVESSPEEERPSARRRLVTKSPSKASASSSALVPKAPVRVQVPESFHIYAQSTP